VCQYLRICYSLPQRMQQGLSCIVYSMILPAIMCACGRGVEIASDADVYVVADKHRCQYSVGFPHTFVVHAVHGLHDAFGSLLSITFARSADFQC
jgi:hypothetical protein